MDSSGSEGVRIHWRIILVRGRTAAHAAEDEKVEEVHPAGALGPLQARSEAGTGPATIRVTDRQLSVARVDIGRILDIQQRVKHEMIALLSSLEEQLGADSRFVHVGLTTNDVWDTATALQLRDAADLLVAGQERLRAALVTALLGYPAVFTGPYPRDVMIKIFLYGLLAQAWNLLGGYCGQISLGNAVFFGIGAYTSTLLGMWVGLSPWLGMLAGMVLAVLVSQAIGFPCFRLRGHYFAIATIAVGEIVQTLALNWEAIGAARGLSLPIRPDSLAAFQFHRSKYPYYYIVLAFLLVCLGISAWIERSRLGYYFRAIREDSEAAASVGIPVTRYKLLAMAFSAAFVAAGGTFYAQYVLFLDPESAMPLSLSILICLLAVVGGVVQIAGVWHPFADFLEGSAGSDRLLGLGDFDRVRRHVGEHVRVAVEPVGPRPRAPRAAPDCGRRARAPAPPPSPPPPRARRSGGSSCWARGRPWPAGP